MSSTLKSNKQKLQEMKRRRQQRNKVSNQSQLTQSNQSQIKIQTKSYSITKSQIIHVPAPPKNTYDAEVQVETIMETRSLDSKAHRQIQQQQQNGNNLLQPKQQKKKKQQVKDDFQIKQVQQLNQQELQSLVKSKHFYDFFNRSSKFLQKVLDHGEADMLELLLKDGFKSKEKNQHDILAHAITFYDHNYSANRVVTDLDWTAQVRELFLASYSQNQHGTIKDHVGVALCWSPQLKSRPQFYCFCQSAITSVKFFPYINNAVIGGCYNGQLMLWDIIAKTSPMQRSGISADAHKYPVNSLSVIGTQLANNIASFSNDGMMCLWDIRQFSKPIRTNKISAARPQRVIKPTGLAPSVLNRSSRLQQLSTSNAIDKSRQQPHELNVSCCQFPKGDANNYYIGSLNGAMYKNALHNRATQNIVMYDDHNGPISSLSINHSPQHEFLNGMILTASYDWTVKLWNPTYNKQALRAFQNSQDFIYDVKWNPANPSLFASVNNQGYVDLFDLTKDQELPVSHTKINNYAQNKLAWKADGSFLFTGDSNGAINVYGLAEKHRRLDPTKVDHLKNILASDMAALQQ